jgi:deoxyribonuclease V
MHVPELHSWDLSYAEARQLQQRMAPQVRLVPLPARIELVAGADMACSRPLELFFATVVVLTYPDLELIEEVTAQHRAAFPYIPGLLSFREGPALVKAFRTLRHVPHAVIFDGQGIAHPRRMGLASHMGLWLGVPTVGCAKSRLTGEHDQPGQSKGDGVPLTQDGEQIGVVLRTRTNVKPVFVSPGHLSDFDTSRRLVLDCCTRYRLPEPTRLADIAVGRAKREYVQQHAP